MAAVVGSIGNGVDVLSKTLQNLRFHSTDDEVIGDRRNAYAVDGAAAPQSPLDRRRRSRRRHSAVLEGPNEKVSFVTMELDILERKIKRLVNKLKKAGIQLFVFDSTDIEYGTTIGKGGEGLVQCCTLKYNGLRIRAVVKTVLNNSDDSLNLTFDEIELLCLARDLIVPTTIQVYGVAAVPDDDSPEMGHLVIIMEAGLMNALQFCQSEDIPPYVMYDIWSHLAAALHCIHSKRIIHQDLKPENILVTRVLRDTCGQLDKVEVKVIDLGMARLVEGECVYTDDILGTEGYHAPEVLFDNNYDFRADIFVLGITFCVMLLPRSSLKKSTLLPTLKRIHDAKHRKFIGSCLFDHIICPMITNGNTMSNDIRDMICSMLESVENRTIALLEIAHTCHKESVLHRCQQLNTAPLPSGSGRLYHQDSGVDSLENAVISDLVTKKNTRSNALSCTALPSAHGHRRTTKRPGAARRRRRVRLTSCSSSSEPNSSSSPPPPPINVPRSSKQNHRTTPLKTNQDEPICRRTRSAKRVYEPTDGALGGDRGKQHSHRARNPPAKRMLCCK